MRYPFTTTPSLPRFRRLPLPQPADFTPLSSMKLKQFRTLHRIVAPIVLLPLMVTMMTGVSYRLGKSWFGLSRDQVHFLMVIHEGEYLGQVLEPIYVLLNGIGLLWMMVTGGVMVYQNLRSAGWFQPSRSTD